MQKNVGTIDRWVRAIVGFILIAAAFLLEANGLTTTFYFVGVVFLLTAITGFCLFYKPFGIDTTKE